MNPRDLRRAVQAEIQGVLTDPSSRGAGLIAAIVDLGGRHDIEPFRACLHELTRTDRPELEARDLIEQVDRHRAELEARLKRDPGLGVAALDLLHDLRGLVLDPVFRDAPTPGRPIGAARMPAAWPLDDALTMEMRRGERFGHPLAVAILAPDRPAEAAAGIMESAATALKGACRDTDVAGRLVPDGFGIIFPCTARDEALRAAERLRQVLTVATRVTWSAGLASCPEQPWEPETLAATAGGALAEARVGGGASTRAHHPERRAHPRRLAPVTAFTVLLRWDGEETRAGIEDLSLGGARLVTEAPVGAGTDVVVAFRENSARPREVVVPSRVVRTEPAPPGRPGSPACRAAIAFRADPEGRLRIAGLLGAFGEDSVVRGEGVR